MSLPLLWSLVLALTAVPQSLVLKPLPFPWHHCSTAAVAAHGPTHQAATLDAEGRLLWWHLADGRLLADQRLGAGKQTPRLAFAQKGRLVVLSADGSVSLREATRSTPLRRYELPPCDGWSHLAARDGRLAVSCEARVHLFSLDEPRPHHHIDLPEPITAMTFAPGAEELLLCRGLEFGTLDVYAVSEPKHLRTLSLDSPTEKAHPSAYLLPANQVVVSADGRYAASAGFHYAKVFDYVAGKLVASVRQEQDMGPGIMALAFAAENTHLVTVQSGTVRRWDWRNEKETSHFDLPARTLTATSPPSLLPDGTRLVAGHGDGTVSCHDLTSGKAQWQAGGPGANVHTLAFAPDGKRLYGGTGAGRIHEWRVTPPREERRLEVSRDDVRALVVTPDGRALLHTDGQAIVRRTLPDLAEASRLAGHTAPVLALALSADGRQLASGGADNQVCLWLLDGHGKRWCRTVHEGPVTALAMGTEGRKLASGSEDGTLRLWDLTEGEVLWESFVGEDRHGQPVTSLTFLPGGTEVAVGTAFVADAGIFVYETEAGRMVRKRTDSSPGIAALGLSPRGPCLLAGRLDAELLLLDPQSLEPRGRGAAYDGYGVAVASSPDGRTVALGTAGNEGAVRLWECP